MGTDQVFDFVPTTLFDLSVRYCFGDRVLASCPVWGDIPCSQLVALHRWGYRAEAHPIVPTGFDGMLPQHPALILGHDRNTHRPATLKQPPGMLVAASLLYVLLEELTGHAWSTALRAFLNHKMVAIADLFIGLDAPTVVKIAKSISREDAA